MAVLAVLITIGWFATGGIRAGQAAKLDSQSQSAMAAGQLDTAYRKAQFAAALEKTGPRMQTLGALAYVRGDYAAAKDAFAEAGASPESGLGSAAAAAGLGDRSAFEAAAGRIGTPTDRILRLGLAAASIDAGDPARADRLLASDRPSVQEVTYLKSIGQAATNPAEAARTLRAAGRGTVSITAGTDAYASFLRKLITVAPDSLDHLAETVQAMSVPASDATRDAILANGLYRLGEYRAAETEGLASVTAAPEYRDGWNALAAAQLAVGKTKDAGRSIKTSLDLDPAFGFTWYLRSQLAKQQDDPDKAREYRDRAAVLGYRP